MLTLPNEIYIMKKNQTKVAQIWKIQMIFGHSLLFFVEFIK